MEPGTVVTLAELVEIQPGAVVSRELIKQAGGTVTVFAFDGGQGLSEHTAPFDALVQVLAGKVEITISGQPYHLSAGQAILMPAHEPHALKALTPLKLLLVMIR